MERRVIYSHCNLVYLRQFRARELLAFLFLGRLSGTHWRVIIVGGRQNGSAHESSHWRAALRHSARYQVGCASGSSSVCTSEHETQAPASPALSISASIWPIIPHAPRRGILQQQQQQARRVLAPSSAPSSDKLLSGLMARASANIKSRRIISRTSPPSRGRFVCSACLDSFCLLSLRRG